MLDKLCNCCIKVRGFELSAVMSQVTHFASEFFFLKIFFFSLFSLLTAFNSIECSSIDLFFAGLDLRIIVNLGALKNFKQIFNLKFSIFTKTLILKELIFFIRTVQRFKKCYNQNHNCTLLLHFINCTLES